MTAPYRLPLHPGCHRCELVRDYLVRMETILSDVRRQPSGNGLSIEQTVDMTSMPTCPEHLERGEDWNAW